VIKDIIELLIAHQGRIIAVGTTSVRTLESLYWLGVKLFYNPLNYGSAVSLGQWEPYNLHSSLSVKDSMNAILAHLSKSKMSSLNSTTSIMIVPGYDFRMINGIITNFHQPKSTLLLLISAWVGFLPLRFDTPFCSLGLMSEKPLMNRIIFPGSE